MKPLRPSSFGEAQDRSVRAGYKQTEVGVIPEEWDVATIKEHTAIKTGKRNTQDRVEDGQYPFFVRSQTIERINSYSFDGEAVLTAGDGVGTGKVFHYINGPFDYHQRVYRVSDFSPQLNGQFFHLVFSTRFYDRIMSMTAKSSVDSVRLDMIAEMPIPLPPLPEQRAIAEALSEVDGLLGGLDRLIAKKRDLKQAAMQQLLTGQTRLPGFHGDWERRSLRVLSAFITKGATPTTYGFNWEDDGIPFLRSECVSERGLDLEQAMFISRKAHDTLKRGEIRSGDILITITGNVGRVILLKPDFGIANINQHIARIRVSDPSVLVDFVFHYLAQPLVRKYFGTIVTGQAYPQISLKQVRELVIPLPPLPEQTAIAAVLSDMDAELAALEQRRDKTRALKQGMMQELLTGRTRLPVAVGAG